MLGDYDWLLNNVHDTDHTKYQSQHDSANSQECIGIVECTCFEYGLNNEGACQLSKEEDGGKSGEYLSA